ncbi:MAG: sugar ABC transporter ATP-binding protein [Hespellia sp.]|nr:sugar ABC transporter ATP-binding protein [Hespellia sp.]
MSNNEYVLQMSNISKSFSGVKVLDSVKLDVRPGEVHVLIGENGAGKSTLMKILIGMYTRDEGTVIYKGEEIKIRNTKEALDVGITMIHQELSPILEMTVAENIFLGREFKTKVGFVDQKKMKIEAQKLFDEVGISDIKPSAKMKELSTAQTQMVEIVKAVSFNADLIIMDEPTSSITDNEVDKLFSIIRRLTAKNVAVIYISHKLNEIYQISDSITVLRDGEYIATKATKELDKDELVRLMVGRELSDLYVTENHSQSNVVMSVKNLTNGKLFKDINFELHKGEVLGIYGLVGAGRSEVVETIFGMRGKYEGEIFVHGKKIVISSEKDAIKNGIALATEDRKGTGIFLGLPIRNNISMAWLNNLTKLGFVNGKKEKTETNIVGDRLKVKAASYANAVGTLSGGNQQKVVLAKWLLTNPDVLILDEPTRGIDIGAKAEIYKIIEELTSQGKSVIMVSSEMPEILGMSDRIMVIADGENRGVLEHEEISQLSIMNLIAKV